MFSISAGANPSPMSGVGQFNQMPQQSRHPGSSMRDHQQSSSSAERKRPSMKVRQPSKQQFRPPSSAILQKTPDDSRLFGKSNIPSGPVGDYDLCKLPDVGNTGLARKSITRGTT